MLADGDLLVSLLRLVAFAVRLPAPDGRSAETPECQQQREIGFIACRLAAEVLTLPPGMDPEGQQGFAASLLRMQTLHAAARQLAACAAALERGPAPPSPAVCVASLRCVSQALFIVTGMSKPAIYAANQATFVGDLAATHVLEHAARVLLLAAATAGAGAKRGRAGSLLGKAVVQLWGYRYRFGVDPCFSGAAPEVSSAGAARAAWADAEGAREPATAVAGEPSMTAGLTAAGSAVPLILRQLRQVITGPCVRHAVFVLGLEALGELEGGAEERGGGPCPCTRAGPRPAAETSDPDLGALIYAVVQTLRTPAASGLPGGARAGAGPWPRPLAATRLLLRLGSVVARDAEGGGQAAGPSDSQGGGAGGSRSGAGAGEHSGGAPVHSPRLHAGACIGLAEGVLAGILWRLPSGPSPLQGPWPGLVEDTWRLAAALLRGEVLSADIVRLCIIPPSPPSSLSPALAGGALPLLEGLLRQAGEDPGGPAAVIMGYPSYQESVLPLLAYGEPLQAGALVATVTKLLRRAEPREILVEPMDLDCHGVAFVKVVRADAYYIRCMAAVATGDETASAPSAADSAAPTADGDPSPAASGSTPPGDSSPAGPGSTPPGAPSTVSPAAGRLALVLSLALPEWLPELSRLVRQAAAMDEAAWAEEQERAQAQQRAAASGEGGGEGRGAASGEGSCVGGGSGGADGLVAAGTAGGEEAASTSYSASDLETLYACFEALFGHLITYHESPLEAADASAWCALTAHGRPLSAPAPSALRAEAVRALAGVIRGGGAEEALATSLDQLARCLEARAAGEEATLGDGYEAAYKRTWWTGRLVPPAEARRRLGLPPACSHPACVSLAGDSEAGLRRQQCGRCGRASYCCRECQVAHWKAGHKEACGKAAVVE
ncbi:hypothetical protein HYH03_009932 [Edaphochlamys debaryana]|uniref:phytol kinase n=1 Tax=Edaphochlamys debaryana TaxID=47281 RepID=A0A836BWJ2_9CHLO|nr:hypothetical protein HYH03_009932 [Edaphochlamys debaryana]|eukprot:KAG2491771.1 hypothetical protein HYH03_009932 [Edaphochlamys debaryana]